MEVGRSRLESGPVGLPVALPPDAEWIVRVIASTNRFVFGV